MLDRLGIDRVKLVLIYIYPDLNHHIYNPLARRFVESYLEHPPGETDHEIIVAVNSGRSGCPEYEQLMRPLSCDFVMHDNQGKDIGAFQVLSRRLDCDLMICLGAPVHFCRSGWLDRIRNVYEQEGPGLYSPWAFHEPKPHVRTTAFWLPPQLFRSYPHEIYNGNRYEFEHGDRSIYAHTKQEGLEAFQVTWDGCYTKKDWHQVTASSTLFLDQHTDRNRLQ